MAIHITFTRKSKISIIVFCFVSLCLTSKMLRTLMPQTEHLKEHVSAIQGDFIARGVPIQRRDPEPFCEGLFRNDARVIKEAYAYMRNYKARTISDQEYISLTRNCDVFTKTRGYIMSTLTEEEANFPIAFSILMYKDSEQVERLLRAIYMPQNYYCIHVDIKASPSVYNAMSGMAKCLPNVFLATKRVSVGWGTMSVVDADLSCMDELMNYERWKYFINLTGQEMPLLSNRQLVRLLKAFNGSNNIEIFGGYGSPRVARRTKFELAPLFGYEELMYTTFRRKSKPPHGLRLTTGSVHIISTRGYVEYVTQNPVARDFREWVKDTFIPDETFFSTLNYNPKLKVPGSYAGSSPKDPFIARYKVWASWPFDYGACHGTITRGICIFGIEDLVAMKNRPEPLVNKLYKDFQYLTLNCLEELQYNRTVASVRKDFVFSDSIYRSKDHTRHHF